MTIKKSTDNYKRGKGKSTSSMKQYKNIYMTGAAIDLLNTITFESKLKDTRYTMGDAVLEGLTLLAKKKGIN